MFSIAGIFDGVSDGIALWVKYFSVLKQELMVTGNDRVGVISSPPEAQVQAAMLC